MDPARPYPQPRRLRKTRPLYAARHMKPHMTILERLSIDFAVRTSVSEIGGSASTGASDPGCGAVGGSSGCGGTGGSGSGGGSDGSAAAGGSAPGGGGGDPAAGAPRSSGRGGDEESKRPELKLVSSAVSSSDDASSGEDEDDDEDTDKFFGARAAGAGLGRRRAPVFINVPRVRFAFVKVMASLLKHFRLCVDGAVTDELHRAAASAAAGGTGITRDRAASLPASLFIGQEFVTEQSEDCVAFAETLLKSFAFIYFLHDRFAVGRTVDVDLFDRCVRGIRPSVCLVGCRRETRACVCV